MELALAIGLALSALEQRRIVDGDGGVRSDRRHQLFEFVAEHARLLMAEKQAAQDVARPRDDRYGEIAHNGQVSFGHPEIGAVSPIPGIAPNVVRADDAL